VHSCAAGERQPEASLRRRQVSRRSHQTARAQTTCAPPQAEPLGNMDVSSTLVSGVAGGLVAGVLVSKCLAPPGATHAAAAAPTTAGSASAAVRYVYSCEGFSGTPPADAADAKVVHFIRHAQGHHNLAVATEGEQAYANWAWRDSRLTPKGLEQSAEAAPVTDRMKFDTVLVSPLSRTLQTAINAVPSMHGKMVAEELVRERIGLNPCDLRREKNVLVKEFPEVNFDQLCSETDALWSTERESLHALQDRCDAFLECLFEGPATKDATYVGVVTHNDFLTMLLYDSSLQYSSSLVSS
jgi:broad specificity phosphatase PhoE